MTITRAELEDIMATPKKICCHFHDWEAIAQVLVEKGFQCDTHECRTQHVDTVNGLETNASKFLPEENEFLHFMIAYFYERIGVKRFKSRYEYAPWILIYRLLVGICRLPPRSFTIEQMMGRKNKILSKIQLWESDDIRKKQFTQIVGAALQRVEEMCAAVSGQDNPKVGPFLYNLEELGTWNNYKFGKDAKAAEGALGHLDPFWKSVLPFTKAMDDPDLVEDEVELSEVLEADQEESEERELDGAVSSNVAAMPHTFETFREWLDDTLKTPHSDVERGNIIAAIEDHCGHQSQAGRLEGEKRANEQVFPNEPASFVEDAHLLNVSDEENMAKAAANGANKVRHAGVTQHVVVTDNDASNAYHGSTLSPIVESDETHLPTSPGMEGRSDVVATQLYHKITDYLGALRKYSESVEGVVNETEVINHKTFAKWNAEFCGLSVMDASAKIQGEHVEAKVDGKLVPSNNQESLKKIPCLKAMQRCEESARATFDELGEKFKGNLAPWSKLLEDMSSLENAMQRIWLDDGESEGEDTEDDGEQL